MGLSSHARAEATRERIIEAASNLLCKHGSYQTTRMSLILWAVTLCVGAASAANSSRHSQSFAAEAERRPAAPTGAPSTQFAARQRGVWATGKLLLDERQRNPGMCCAC
jgi:hypothetical protein